MKLKEDNAVFGQVMAACESNIQECRGFKLPSFLMKGMQRLLKYHPLLTQILKHTQASDSQRREELQVVLDGIEVRLAFSM